MVHIRTLVGEVLSPLAAPALEPWEVGLVGSSSSSLIIPPTLLVAHARGWAIGGLGFCSRSSDLVLIERHVCIMLIVK